MCRVATLTGQIGLGLTAAQCEAGDSQAGKDHGVGGRFRKMRDRHDRLRSCVECIYLDRLKAISVVTVTVIHRQATWVIKHCSSIKYKESAWGVVGG